MTKPQPPQGVSLSGPTCPVCWPWVKLDPELAELHRTWHSLRAAWMAARARWIGYDQEGDALRDARTLAALEDFERLHPELTAVH